MQLAKQVLEREKSPDGVFVLCPKLPVLFEESGLMLQVINIAGNNWCLLSLTQSFTTTT